MSKITVLALLATLAFFGWIGRKDNNAAHLSPASFTSSAVAALNPVESAPKRRSKIDTEALLQETTLAAQPKPAPPESTPDSLPQPDEDVRHVSASTLRMRAGPSTSAELVGSYPRGSAMTIQEQSGAWYRVTAPDGRTGWMALKYLS
jgi:uncharacterized protein YgiM (DUF1202 family)